MLQMVGVEGGGEKRIWIWRETREGICIMKRLFTLCCEMMPSPPFAMKTSAKSMLLTRLVRIKFSRVKETPESNVINKTDVSFLHKRRKEMAQGWYNSSTPYQDAFSFLLFCLRYSP